MNLFEVLCPRVKCMKASVKKSRERDLEATRSAAKRQWKRFLEFCLRFFVTFT